MFQFLESLKLPKKCIVLLDKGPCSASEESIPKAFQEVSSSNRRLTSAVKLVQNIGISCTVWLSAVIPIAVYRNSTCLRSTFALLKSQSEETNFPLEASNYASSIFLVNNDFFK